MVTVTRRKGYLILLKHPTCEGKIDTHIRVLRKTHIRVLRKTHIRVLTIPLAWGLKALWMLAGLLSSPFPNTSQTASTNRESFFCKIVITFCGFGCSSLRAKPYLCNRITIHQKKRNKSFRVNNQVRLIQL